VIYDGIFFAMNFLCLGIHIFFSPSLVCIHFRCYTTNDVHFTLLCEMKLLKRVMNQKKERCNILTDVHPIFIYFHQNIIKYAF